MCASHPLSVTMGGQGLSSCLSLLALIVSSMYPKHPKCASCVSLQNRKVCILRLIHTIGTSDAYATAPQITEWQPLGHCATLAAQMPATSWQCASQCT